MGVINIDYKRIECLNRHNFPEKGETIADDFDLDSIVPLVAEVIIYSREKDVCPFERGNWIIDVEFLNKNIFCLKLPLKMTADEVMEWTKPLRDKLEEHKNKQES